MGFFRFRIIATLATLLAGCAAPFLPAAAGPAPAEIPAPSKPSGLARDEIALQLDVHNLVGPAREGYLEPRRIQELLEQVNGVWDQCSIRFSLRKAENLGAGSLKVGFVQTSMDDLYRVAGAVLPDGLKGAIPLILGGSWKVRQPDGSWLNGLGWAFVNSAGIDRTGALVNSDRLDSPVGALIVAHELAHALSLPHVTGSDNLMGAGGPRLTPEQCEQARGFASSYLGPFQIASEKRNRLDGQDPVGG